MSEWLTKNKMMVAVLTVLAVILVAGVAIWANGRGGAKTGSSDARKSQSSGGLTAESSGTPGQPGKPGAPGAKRPTSTPASGENQKAPSAPLKKGEKLYEITSPPSETIAMIEPKAATKNAVYLVTFQPYGTGPGGPTGDGFVVYISKSEPQGKVDKVFDFNKKNVLAVSSGPDAAAIKAGGTYTAELTLAENGGLLVPTLKKVKAQ